MSDAPPKRSWKRQRWIVWTVIYLAAILLYPLSYGPVRYGVRRGQIDSATVAMFYRPIDPILGYDRPWNPFRRHFLWWYQLAVDQERKEMRDQGITPGPLTPPLH